MKRVKQGKERGFAALGKGLANSHIEKVDSVLIQNKNGSPRCNVPLPI